jgi:hypothetical protein
MSYSLNPLINPTWPKHRRWIRAPINVRVRILFEREGTPQQCHCRSFSVSQGGIGLISPYALEVDQMVILEFRLPGTVAPLKLRAVTRSKAGFRLDCEFVLLTDKQKAEIVRYENAYQSRKFS